MKSDLDHYVSWVKHIQTLAVICHKWNNAASETQKQIWKQAAILQLKTINWRAGELSAPREIPKEFPVCKKVVMTREQLLELVSEMFDYKRPW